MRRLLIAGLVGLMLTAVPLLVLWVPWESGFMDALRFVMTFVLVPGALLNIIATGGKAHDVTPWVMGIANLVFYSGLTYIMLRLQERCKAQH